MRAGQKRLTATFPTKEGHEKVYYNVSMMLLFELGLSHESLT